jgi:hypothetical protein
MKSVPLKVVEINEEAKLDYKNEIRTILITPEDRQAGANIDEMRLAIRVLDVLDALDENADVMELEDADYSYLQGRVQNARFGMVHPAIVQFIDDISQVE